MKYKALINVVHKDGERITIEVSGRTADKVSHVANSIRNTFKEACVDTHASVTRHQEAASVNKILACIQNMFRLKK
jgi:capsular polysaccharide biosynthesis protein